MDYFKFHNRFILRTPLLPFSTVDKFNIKGDELIKLINEDNVVMESVYLASKSLYNEIKIIKNQGEDKTDRTRVSLIKYLNRMCTRPTPFGLFSGVSSGTFSDTGDIILKDGPYLKRSCRLDMHVSCLINDLILKDNSIREKMRLRLNNTLNQIDDQVRYVSYINKGIDRFYDLMMLDSNTYLDKVISTCKNSVESFHISELVKIISDEQVSSSEAYDFIDSLINLKILISETEIGLSHFDYINHLSALLKNKGLGLNHNFSIIELLKDKLDSLRKSQVGSGLDIYIDISKILENLQLNHDNRYEVQVDLIKETKDASLDHSIIEELRGIISILSRTVEPDYFLSKELLEFKSSFEDRYESQEIPLTEVLDNDNGIGFPVNKKRNVVSNWMLKNIDIFNSIKNEEQVIRKTRFDFIIEQKYVLALKNGLNEIEMVDKDFESLENSKLIFPGSLSSLISVLAKDSEAIRKGDFKVIHNITTGPGSSNLFARFSFWDESIAEIAKDLNTQEDNCSSATIAEIVHLPDNRIANILCRTSSKRPEIPVFTPPSDYNNSIQLDDLMVSVVNDRVILRSKKLNQLIEPRLTSAHNFHNDTVPYYHFLSALQFQAPVVELNWRWGALSTFEFLPRVNYKKSILSLARWNFRPSRSLDLAKYENWLKEFSDFFSRWGIPPRFFLVENDRKLFLDISDVSSHTILFKEYKKKEILILEECIWSEDQCFVKDETGMGYTNEIVIPILNEESKHKNDPIEFKIESNGINRSYMPGSEWTFFKVYCGINLSDRILTELILPFIKNLYNNKFIDKWFFIRFRDPRYHIRLRLLLNTNYKGNIISDFNIYLNSSDFKDLVHDLKIDTYTRELERYGQLNIENSETFFFHDSNFVADLIDILKHDEFEFWRQVVAIKSVNQILDFAGYTLKEKLKFCDEAMLTFFNEFDIDRLKFKKTLTAKYKIISDKLMKNDLHDEKDISEKITHLMNQRGDGIKTCLNKIFELRSKNRLGTDIDSLMRSYIHIFLNRLFPTDQRLIELFTYDLVVIHIKRLLSDNSFTSNN